MAGRVLQVAGLAVLFLCAALGLAACGGGTTSSSGMDEAKAGKVREIGLVDAYCLYRSDTKAQMLACGARTNAAQVQAADDEAARWARGELQACGKNAGELCQYYREPAESQVEGETR